MTNKRHFFLSGIAASLALIATPATIAQDASSAQLEELVVTGIRGSLNSAAAVKRNESGVVDSISAEDIGKFPDANLAESLQRITGVSIDRQDNEGNQISVRGLGPSFNLVTLNGRQMPVASSPDLETLNSATQSRAFNFAEIASESVTAVNVFKTARPDLPSGGIGATVDIRTSRPFDYAVGDLKALVSAAGVHDFSSEEGSAVTPEIGGLISYNFNDVFGISATGSFSERNFRNELSQTESFDVFTLAEFANDPPTPLDSLIAEGLVPADTEVIFAPRTFLAEFSDNQRERINFQGTAQVRPTENFVITGDVTVSIFDLEEQRQETALFNLLSDPGVFGSTVAGGNLQLDENGTVLFVERDGVAFDAIATDNELRVENTSFGLNFAWDVGNFAYEIDAHASEAISQPDGIGEDGSGQSNDLVAIFQGSLNNNVDIALSGEQPVIDIDDSGASRGAFQFGGTDPDGDGPLEGPEFQPGCEPGVATGFTPECFSPLGSIGRVLQIENDVSQLQVRVNWNNADDAGTLTSIDFGAGFIEYDVATRFADFPFAFQGLVPCVDPCSADLFETVSTDSFDGIFPFINAFDALNAINTPGIFSTPSLFPQLGDIDIVEETFSFYFNTNWETEFNGWGIKLAAGARLETTDVESSSDISIPSEIAVAGGSEASVNFSPETIFVEETGAYTNFLPAIDLQLQPHDDVVIRLSYGVTLARPDLNALRPGLAIADVRPFGPFNATLGNADLEPFLSDNFDAALEWYFQEGSFAAVTFFNKSVENFIGTETFSQEVLDINGDPLTDPSARLVFNADNPSIVDGVLDPITGDLIPTPAPDAPDGAPTPLPATGAPTDPIASFDVTQSVNANDATINGVELAVQHAFGDSGFGLQANYTFVESGAEFDPFSLDQVEQSLIGLSDTANLVLFYENNTFDVRVAANWRDEFLFATDQLRVPGEPVFFDEFVQVDLSASYNINDSVTIFLEGLNLTGEDQTQRGRFSNQFLLQNEQQPRVTLGARIDF